MKIGIDVRRASDPKNGKGIYTFHIVKNLLIIDKQNEYVLYTDTLSEKLAEMVAGASTKTQVKFISAHFLLWHFLVIKDFLRHGTAGDLFFSPTSFIIPAFLPKRIKSMITVHDLIAFLFPRGHETKAWITEQIFFRHALKKAAHVLVPSENTKKDLIRMFGYDKEKITVTPLAASVIARPEGPKQSNVGSKTQLDCFVGLRPPRNDIKDFILTVGTLAPRKNIEILVDVILRLSKDDKLVIVGSAGWQSAKLLKKIAAHHDRIVHLPAVSHRDLSALYRAAKVFVYPSLYEGFGLPPLEAMAEGCPVICSNAASLPEVCGEAALYFNPKKPEELAEALQKMLADETLRAQLIQKGLVQAQKFSWKQTAQRTLEAFLV